MSSSDYMAASADMLAEVIREAEARLQAQLTAAIAADQRAMTFAGLMVAAAAAMIGAALGASADAALTAPTVITAFGLLISAALAVVAARPVPWDFVGNTPSSWVQSIGAKQTLQSSLADMADFYAQMINDNEVAIAAAAFWIRLSMWTALASLVLGLALATHRLL